MFGLDLKINKYITQNERKHRKVLKNYFKIRQWRIFIFLNLNNRNVLH
jgi:hypothetical protein